MKNYIADKFKTKSLGISLDTEAISKYKDIIDLSIGDTDIITDERIINAAFSDAKKGYTRYGNPKGDPELISAFINAWKEDYNQEILPDSVLVSASSCLGMAIVMFSILNPGDEVIVFSPYFPMYKGQIELPGGVCVEVPCYASENFAIDETRLRSAITEKTKAIIFNNPANPSGMAYERDTIEMLARIAKEYDILIVSDEIYTTYLFEGDFCPVRTVEGMEDRTITLNSFSKNFMMTGWRVGLIIAHPDLIDVMNRINGGLIYSAPSISQRAGIEALKLRKDIKDKYVSIYKSRVIEATKRINEIEYLELVAPKGTFYLFPSIKKTGLTSNEFAARLLEDAHILVTSGAPFGITGEGHFRIACTVEDTKLYEAFDRMAKLKF